MGSTVRRGLPRRSSECTVLAIGVVLLGCSGQSSQGEGGGGGDRSSLGGNSANTGQAGSEGINRAACSLPPARIWKLTPRQMEASVAALIPGAPAVAEALSDSLPSSFKGAVVVNEAAALVMSGPHVTGLLGVADELAARAWTVRATLDPCLGGGAIDRACMERVTSSFVTRAYRRPLATSERDALVTFWAKEKTAAGDEVAFKQWVSAVLLSPHFLYRTELGDREARGSGGVTLTAHEKATLLSYLLLDGPPDDALAAAADAGEIDTEDGLRSQVRRLLSNRNTANGVMTFFDQHFSTGRLPGMAKDSKTFPQWNAALAGDLRQGTQRFVEEVLWHDDGTLRTLLTAEFTMANPQVARLQDLAPPSGNDFARVSVAATPRRGVLTTPGVMAALSRDLDTFVVQRGKFVREAVLCQEIPPPPPTLNVVPIPPDGEHTQRELLAVHTADATCATCHVLMDPLGLAFENFDAIGKQRDSEFGKPLDVSGHLGDVRNPEDFDGPVSLTALLAEQPETGPCLVRRWYAFAAGRVVGDADACAMSDLAESFTRDGGQILPMIERDLSNPKTYQRLR